MADYFDPGGQSDNHRLARSRLAVATVLAGTYGAIQLPHKAFVKDVWFECLVQCTGTARSITVGFSGNKETADTDFFMTAADNLEADVGVTRATQATYNFEGKYFSEGAGAITVTTTELTAGKFRVFCEYSVIH